MTHDDVRELFAEYLFGTLEASARANVEAHLTACDACRGELAEEARVLDALGRGVDPAAPPPALRERILRAARAEAAAPAIITPTAPRRAPSRPLPWLLAAAAVLVALVAGWQMVAARGERQRLAAQVSEQQRSLAVLAAGDLVRFELRGDTTPAHARAFWSHRHGLVFSAEGLQPVPSGRTYQLWAISGGKPISVGVFAAGSNGAAAVVVETPASLTAVEAVAVTVEPAGGLAAPSTTPILVGAAGN